jgi:glutamine amidotransferase
LVAIIKYNAGNVQSVRFALDRLGVESVWTDDPAVLRSADKVIFPGVGEASSAMAYLKLRGLDAVIKSLEQPVLGICLGLQLFCSHSEEGDTSCLGIFDAAVQQFKASPFLKVPHMGWNTLEHPKGPLFEGVPDGSSCYFVHSYYAETGPDTIAGTNYGGLFSAALQHNQFYAVQFHPEKSGPVGQRILQNFIHL